MGSGNGDDWVGRTKRRAAALADDRVTEITSFAADLIPELKATGHAPDAVCTLFSGPEWDPRDLDDLHAWAVIYWEVQWATLRLYLIENGKVCVLPGANVHGRFMMARSATSSGSLRDLPEFFAMQKLRWRVVEDDVEAALHRLAERFGLE